MKNKCRSPQRSHLDISWDHLGLQDRLALFNQFGPLGGGGRSTSVREKEKKNLDSYDPQIEKLSDLAVICLGWTLMGHFLMYLGFSAGLLP